MKRQGKFAILALGLAIGTASLPAFAATTSSPMSVVNTAITAAQHIDPKPLAKLYTNDAVFIDEGPPHTWYGRNVGTAWAAGVKRHFASMKMSNFTATASKPTTTHISATGAYIAVPMVLNGTTSKGPFHEDGAFAFTLRNDNGTWKISSQTWTVIQPKR